MTSNEARIPAIERIERTEQRIEFYAKHGCDEDTLRAAIQTRLDKGDSPKDIALYFVVMAFEFKESGEVSLAKHLMARATYTLLNY